eukprot:s7408_g2.t3
MTFPETFHDDSHYWFKIDEYSTIDSDFVNGKAFFCQACESHYRDATSFTDHAYPSNCLGCAYKSALSQCAWSVVVVDYRVLKHTEADRTDYGKTVWSYGGLRVSPGLAVDYASLGKAKQLSCDRSYYLKVSAVCRARPRGAQEASRGAQEASRGAQEASRGVSRAATWRTGVVPWFVVHGHVAHGMRRVARGAQSVPHARLRCRCLESEALQREEANRRRRMASFASKRLAQERAAFKKDHPFGFYAKYAPNEDGKGQNVFKWNCGIPGRAKGPWEGATYALTMEFTEDYPSKPPKCKFAHVHGKPLFHPNVYPSGTVCLSILNEDEDWKPAITIRQILLGIQDLLDNPNAASPAQEEPYRLFSTDKNEYLRRVKKQGRLSSPWTETLPRSTCDRTTQAKLCKARRDSGNGRGPNQPLSPGMNRRPMGWCNRLRAKKVNIWKYQFMGPDKWLCNHPYHEVKFTRPYWLTRRGFPNFPRSDPHQIGPKGEKFFDMSRLHAQDDRKGSGWKEGRPLPESDRIE